MPLSTTDLTLAPSAAIDLQIHTTYSDGTWAPAALLDHLVQAQFGLVAITDHDRTDGLVTLQQLALEQHMPILVAVEMTCTWRGEMTDLLCFGFDPAHNALDPLAHDLLRRQCDNTRETYANLLRQGYALPADPAVLAALLAQPSPSQPHALVALLKQHGYGLGDPSAGKIALAAGVAFATHEPAVVIDAAHQSGAVCVIAHPGRDDGFVTYDVALLDEFRREMPIDGIEAYYPRHTSAQVAMYQAYAQRHHLLVSAGSDSHGPEKPPIQYRAELCRALLERVGIPVTHV